ncbi:FecR family protein [Bacteroides fragilis]|nr:FecR family protein [Bacteroides fragilis]
MLLSRKAEPEVWYVLNSGRQSMDSVRLADGTLVMLNAGSRLTYPKEFFGNKRSNSFGQAFFSVHPDKGTPLCCENKEYGYYNFRNSI